MFVHRPSRSVILNITDPFALRSMLPGHTRALGDAEEGNIAVKINSDTIRILKNLGIDVPHPINLFYDWPGKCDPFNHQRIMAQMLIDNIRCFNISEMGTGKTYAALWAADYLMKLGLVRRALVIAPLSTIETVWAQDIFDIVMHRSSAIVHGSKLKREKALNQDVDFYITNHNGIEQPEVARCVRRRTDIDLVILDEADFFTNHDTDKYKYLDWVLEKKPRFWMMTGTPTPNEPADAWALARLMNKDSVSRYKGNFKRETMVEVSKFKWVPRRGHEHIVFKALQPAVRFLKKDCLSLPPQSTIAIQAPLTPQQIAAYKQMKEDLILTHNAQLQIGVTITAQNAADQITKLRQILLGSIKNPKTGVYETIPHAPRTRELIHQIKQAQAKVIVIFPFKGIIREMDKELTAAGYSCAIINGDVGPGRRRQIITDFKKKKDPHLLLCHTSVMSHGLNLTEADFTIFYGPIFSNRAYRQVIERNNRTGQTLPMTVVRMGGHPLEWSIYRTLDGRGSAQEKVLNLYNQIIYGGGGV